MPIAVAKRHSHSAYSRQKDRAKTRSAAITLAGQDIAPLPKIADPERRARADRDLKFFCETYFPHGLEPGPPPRHRQDRACGPLS